MSRFALSYTKTLKEKNEQIEDEPPKNLRFFKRFEDLLTRIKKEQTDVCSFFIWWALVDKVRTFFFDIDNILKVAEFDRQMRYYLNERKKINRVFYDIIQL